MLIKKTTFGWFFCELELKLTFIEHQAKIHFNLKNWVQLNVKINQQCVEIEPIDSNNV
jgi:hypothetical protein